MKLICLSIIYKNKITSLLTSGGFSTGWNLDENIFLILRDKYREITFVVCKLNIKMSLGWIKRNIFKWISTFGLSHFGRYIIWAFLEEWGLGDPVVYKKHFFCQLRNPIFTRHITVRNKFKKLLLWCLDWLEVPI